MTSIFVFEKDQNLNHKGDLDLIKYHQKPVTIGA